MRQFLAFFMAAATTVATPSAHGVDATERITSAASEAKADLPLPYGSMFEALYALEPDANQVAAVSGLSIPLEAGALFIESGQLSMLGIEGKSLGFAFSGKARFIFEPQTEVERAQVERFYEAPSLDMEVGRFVMIHEAPRIQAFLDSLNFGPGQLEGGARDIVEQAMDYLGDEDSQTFDSQVMSVLLNGAELPFIHLHMDPDDDDPVYYRYDASHREEVEYGRRAKTKTFETISSFRSTSDVEWQRVERDVQVADIVTFDVATVLDDGLDFSASAALLIVPNRGGPVWIPFALYSELEVDSVAWEGAPVEFHRGEESPQLWVQTPETAEAGMPGELVVHYHGDLIDRSRIGWYFIKSATGWYPRTGQIDATFSLRFEVPDEFEFTAAGKEVARRRDGDVIHWEYLVDRPAPHATFNIGKFEEYPIEREGVPPINLQFNKQAHKQLEQFLLQENVGEMVGQDVANALAFFGERFGELPVEEFSVTEIPYSHGQAFPGMIELSWATFQWTGRSGDDEIFRAHEVAHQWWGLGVEPATYHDTWLSEGLSEFSGLWYMQRVLMNNQKYFDHLEDSRKKIVARRGKAGPIWLGPRLYTSDTESDYQTVVYEKGAWIVHMLRNLMIDTETMNEDVFFGLLKDVYETYRDRRMTTEQFQAAAEAHVGTDLTWFFDQWVYGTGIPKYRFSHRGEATADGWVETIRVEQSEVPDDFKMVVPLLIDFGDEGSAIVRALITGAVSEFQIPPLPREPDNIEFNTLQSVLAEVENRQWR